MKRWLFFVVIAALIAHSGVKTALIVRWKIYREEITELYCINRNRPEMQCNGQCHLAKQMRRIEREYEQSKRPFAPKNLEPVDFQLFCEAHPANAARFSGLAILPLKGGIYRAAAAESVPGELLDPPQGAALPDNRPDPSFLKTSFISHI